MKIKLTPELSYIIGLWRKKKCFDGLGVRGDSDLLATFSSQVLEQNLTTTDKLLSQEEKVYFYHTAYRKFFQDVEEGQLERFKYLNEYAANYLAGLFDAVGEISDKGIVSLSKANSQDEMLLLRLGFKARKSVDRLVIEKPVVFLAFIKNYVKIKKDNKVFQLIKGATIKSADQN
ncbi:MAG: hypothetical protein ACP5N9_00220 [Candidatus Bilamarchaeum sp.]|jgi:hypothetical protein